MQWRISSKGRSQNELHALKTYRMTSWSVVLFKRYWYSLKGDIFSADNSHGSEKKKASLRFSAIITGAS